MKKIALCLSGQPRYIDDGFNEINQYLLKKYNIDVFIHTWYDKELINKKFDFSKENSYGRSGKLEEDTIEKIQKLYNPINFIFEKQIDFKIHDNIICDKQNPLSLYSMYYSIYKSNDLKIKYEKTFDFKYDLVIRCRFDILFEKFDLNILELNENEIFVSGEIKPYLNDQFAISSSDNMNYYSSLYENINKYYNNGFNRFVNEHILKYHMLNNNINYSNIDKFLCNINKK